jgi:tetratricopeptide (TPR) repeat protein
MLVKAAWHLEQAGDADGAFELYRRAAAVGGDAFPDARCYLHKALLDRGDVEAAHELAEEVRRSRPKDPDVFAFIAEDYELAGDLARANRWANMGLRTVLADAGDDPSQVSELALALLNGRARVRQALGFPADEWDARRHRDPATW